MTKTLSPLDTIEAALKRILSDSTDIEDFAYEPCPTVVNRAEKITEKATAALRLIAEMKADCVVVPRDQWPVVSSKWVDKELVWSINNHDVSDVELRRWCFQNMEHNHEKYIDVIRKYHIDAYFNKVIQAAESEQKGEKL